MHCKDVREYMLDVVTGESAAPAEVHQHFQGCAACAQELEGLRRTLGLLDEWQAPAPSPYFDTRLRARLREEQGAAVGGGWLAWLRRPALAATVTAVFAVAVFLFQGGENVTPTTGHQPVVTAQAGTAVGDLQALERNQELFAEFDLLDEFDDLDNGATP